MKEVINIINQYGVPFNVKLKDQDGEFGLIVEFYDARFTEGFTKFGQFVSSYYIDTLLEHEGGLCLEGGIKDWVVSAENMEEVKEWALEKLVERYELKRNPYAKIQKAWLDYDEYGYKAWYLNKNGEENGSWLVTHNKKEAIKKMVEEISR